MSTELLFSQEIQDNGSDKGWGDLVVILLWFGFFKWIVANPAVNNSLYT